MYISTVLLLLSLQYGQGDSKTCSVDPAANRVENAALNKPARQISTYSTWTASKAVDGDNNPKFGDGSCMHTLWEDGLPLYQWWMVDLEKEYRIDSVNITNRLTSEERQRDFDIYVSFNSKFEDDDHMTDAIHCIHVSGEMGGGETRTFTCQTQVFGQFVQIYMETLDKRDMNICEVTVEGYVAVCIEDITTETSLTTKNASAVITIPTATSTALSTTQTTSVSTIPTTTDATLWKAMTTLMRPLATTPKTPQTTSAIATTTTTNATTTETRERTRTTSTSASTTTEITSASSTIPTATSITTTATTIWKRTSPLPVPTTLKTVATTTAVTTSTSMTLSTLVSLPGNTTTVATSTCPCVCVVSSNTTNLTQEARLELVKELKKELTVDKKTTSISKRKLISVGDERQSADTIGFIGVLALCVPVLLIVSFDLINLWSSVKQKKNRVITI